MVNFAPATCEGKGETSKGNYVEAKIGDDGSVVSHKYSGDGVYAAGEELAAAAAGTVSETETLWTLEYKIAIPSSVKTILKKKDHNIKVDAVVRYDNSGSDLDVYSSTNHSAALDWNGKNAVEYTLKNCATKEIAATMDWIAKDRSRFDHESLHGLTVNILGDSYLAGHTMKNPDIFLWHALLAEKYDWNVTNLAANSTPVSPLRKTDAQPTPLVEKYKELPDNDPDLIIFNGGKNDFNNAVPIGSDFSSDNKNTDTFIGAMQTVIAGLQAKYPNAIIVYTSVWNFTGTKEELNVSGEKTGTTLSYSDYSTAAKIACNNYGIFFFEASDPIVSGVDMTNASFKEQYCMSPTDISHLNAEGMKLVMPKYEDFIYRSLNGITDFPPIIDNGGSSSGSTTTTTPETTAPETEAPETTEAPTTETDAEKKKGCGSSVIAPVIVLAAVFGFALSIRRKKYGVRS